MDEPTFHATRFVQPVLRVVVLYLSIIVISSMTMIKPAQAEGTVPAVTNYAAAGYCTGVSLDVVVNCELTYWTTMPYSYVVFPTIVHVYETPNKLELEYEITYQLSYEIATIATPQIHSGVFYIGKQYSCPANSDPTPPNCTCNTSYVPDPTGTSCVSGQYTLSLQTLTHESVNKATHEELQD